MSDLLIKTIQYHINRNLTNIEKTKVNQYFNKLQINEFTDLELLVNFHARLITNKIKEASLDLDYKKTSKPKLKYSYLTLDSNNVYDIQDGKYIWLVNSGNRVLNKGYVNITTPIKNIRYARLGRTAFNHMPEDFVTKANAGNRFGFGFEEFVSQALITPKGDKFQFIQSVPYIDPVDPQVNINLSSFHINKGWFKFRNPIQKLDKLSLKIFNIITDEKILVADLSRRVITDAFLRVTYPSAVFTYYVACPYALPREIFLISDFTTPDPVTYASLITAFNVNQTFSLYNRNSVEFFHSTEVVIPSGAFPSATTVPLTLTSIYDPRFITTLEIISESTEESSSVYDFNVFDDLNNIFGYNDPYKIDRYISDKTYKYSYMLLDSSNINPDISTNTIFGWNISLDNILKTGTAYSSSRVENLVGMHILPITSKFLLPVENNTANGVTGANAANPTGLDMPTSDELALLDEVKFNFVGIKHQNFTVFIHEFSAQSFIAHNGFKYHFNMSPRIMNYFRINVGLDLFALPRDIHYEYITNGKANGWFWFKKPITSFSTLSLSFGNSFKLIGSDSIPRILVPILFVYIG